MKTTRVAIAASATPTNIPATIPAHFVKVEEDAASPSKTFIVNFRQPDGSYSDDLTYGPGIPMIVHRLVGIIAMPPGFAAHLTPAVGQAYMKIRTSDASAADVRVIEHEALPQGNY